MKSLIFSSMLAFSGASLAANEMYVGVDYAYNNIEIANEKVNPNAVYVKAGYEFFEGIALEGQVAASSGDDDLYRMNFELDKSYSVFGRFESPASYGFSADILLGWSWNELAVSGPEETYNGIDSYDGFAWGVGINQQIPHFENVKVRLGYQVLHSDTDFKLANYTLGVSYIF